MSMDQARAIAMKMAESAPGGVEKIKVAKAIKDALGLGDWASPFGYIKKIEEEGKIHSKDFVYFGPKPTYQPGGGGSYNAPPVDPEVLAKAKADVLAQLEQVPGNQMFKDLFTRTVETRNAYNQAIQSLKADGRIVFFKNTEQDAWMISLRKMRVTPPSSDPVDPTSPPKKGFPQTEELPF